MIDKSTNLPCPPLKLPYTQSQTDILPLLLKGLLQAQQPRNAMHNPLHFKQLLRRQRRLGHIFSMEGDLLPRDHFQLSRCCRASRLAARSRGLQGIRV